ncbi:hypothetical protein N9W43_01085 [Litoricolaceae bacterium]|nr:hypothetical protein [Litorivicinaceae bacterium]MDB2424369.1 hypothetical protein [Litorivicinaceae bacterium]MDB2619392.1 hypothetical protein [Litorivicinaceae bacterium]
MDIMDASSEAEWIDEGDIISQSPVDAILPYQVPTTDIETIQLFQALHRPHQRIAIGTTRKHQMYSRYVSAFEN